MNPKLMDVFAGLDEAVVEAAKLRDAATRVGESPGPDELADWLMLQGLASAIEKIYTHVESALYKITQLVDGVPLAKDGSWHTNLLTRMHTALPGIRPAVFSDETYRMAKGLCAFRHLERGIYGTDLDRERVLEKVPVATRLPLTVRADVERLDQAISRVAVRPG